MAAGWAACARGRVHGRSSRLQLVPAGAQQHSTRRSAACPPTHHQRLGGAPHLPARPPALPTCILSRRLRSDMRAR